MGRVRRQLGGVKQKLASSGTTDAGGAGDSDQGDPQRQLSRLRRRIIALEEKVAQQHPDDRIEQLEAEIQELRALGARVAELADLVTELLAVTARRDPELKQTVAKYLDGV